MDRATTHLPIDIRRFPWIRRLAADYAFDFARLADFFSGNPADPDAWHAAVQRTRTFPRRTAEVAAIIAAQQQRRHAPPDAVAAATHLTDPATVAIVTGQQAGLFGGPFFTLLKAITAIRLAERLRAEHHVAAVPVFWIDAEDHDWEEIKTCGVLDEAAGLQAVAIGSPPGAHERPVAHVLLDESVTQAIEALRSSLPGTEFTPELLDELQTCYRPGTGAADAFAHWIERVLGRHGLVVYDASDPASKALLTDVFVREVEHAGETARLAVRAGARLEARGYHAQVTPHEDSLALFHLNSGREPIRVHAGAFTVGDRTETKAALVDRIRRSPHEFSPNVLLRPLVQDTLFPTVCYVAGPNELAYLGQLRGVYDSFGVPMPLIQQRATATILDSNAMRFLARHDLPFEALHAQDEAALNTLLQAQLPPSVESSLRAVEHDVEERMGTLAHAVRQLDATLEGAARSTLGRMQDDLHKLNGKIIQASKRKNDTLRRQFHHARAQAFPAGGPQERQVGFIYFLNKFGPTFVERLKDQLPVEMGNHWLLVI